ncbi:MAG: hypothetical protein RI558_02090 [Psychroflexus sp.]|jgi:hypothetical protein|nr:hypothetical protein [Psychroflexus sp.]MDR9449016.1 hypothetical protein [Psychroflexus sp.]
MKLSIEFFYPVDFLLLLGTPKIGSMGPTLIMQVFNSIGGQKIFPERSFITTIIYGFKITYDFLAY